MNGIELKCERIRSQVLQYELAAALGITQTELCQYENQRKALPSEIEERIRKSIKELSAKQS